MDEKVYKVLCRALSFANYVSEEGDPNDDVVEDAGKLATLIEPIVQAESRAREVQQLRDFFDAQEDETRNLDAVFRDVKDELVNIDALVPDSDVPFLAALRALKTAYEAAVALRNRQPESQSDDLTSNHFLIE